MNTNAKFADKKAKPQRPSEKENQAPSAEVRTHFVTDARPLSVPLDLLALEPTTQISEEYNIGNQSGSSGWKTAATYREEIEKRIARQAEDLYTVNEAAQVLADSRAGKTGSEWTKEMRAAHCAGSLAIRESSSHIPFNPKSASENAAIPSIWTAKQEAIRDFCDLVKGADIEAWLRASAGYGFPAVSGTNGGITNSAPSPNPREKAQDRYNRLLIEILRNLDIDPTSLKRAKGGALKNEEKQRTREVALSAKYAQQGFTERTFKSAWERLPKTD